MNKLKNDSDFSVRYNTYQALGGVEPAKKFDSVYSVDLEILKLTEQGGGGAKIDDENISSETVWSSQKTKEEIDNAGGNVIDDENISSETTFSSEKIVPKITYDWSVNNNWRWYGPTIDLFALYDETLHLDGPKHTEIVIQPDNFWFEIDQWPFGQDNYVDTRNGDQILCVVRVRVIIKNNPHAAEQPDFAFAEVYLIPNNQAADNPTYSSWSAISPTSRYNGTKDFIDENRQGICVREGVRYDYDTRGWRSVKKWAAEWSTPYGCLTAGMNYYHYETTPDPYNLQQNMFQSNPNVGLLGMVEKKSDGYVNYSDDNADANVTKWLFPTWNKAGIINGSVREAKVMLTKFNGEFWPIFRDSATWSGSAAVEIYAPTTAGTAGYVLTSTGGTPEWKEMEDGTVFINLNNGYTTAVQNFYNKCVAKQQVLSCQLIEDNGDGSMSYYLPSSTRYYERNVELWLMTTEDGHNWTNKHYLITNENITVDETIGVFGVQQMTLSQAEYDDIENKDQNTLYIINE